MANQESKEHKTGGGRSTTPEGSRGSHNEIYIRNRSNKDESNDQKTTIYNKVRVLLLSFEFHDLGIEFDKETEDVRQAFERLGYEVIPEKIPMKKSQDKFDEIVNSFLDIKKEDKNVLLIIYYHGHGVASRNGLVFASHKIPKDPRDLRLTIGLILKHLANVDDDANDDAESTKCTKCAKSSTNDCTNCTIGTNTTRKKMNTEWQRFRPVAEVLWHPIKQSDSKSDKAPKKKSLRDKILDAECDTLVILDCCDAGFAAVGRAWKGFEKGDKTAKSKNNGEEWKPFRKELIGACGWGNETTSGMTPALCESMEHQLSRQYHAVSMTTIVRDMNNILGEKFLEDDDMENTNFPQAVHYLLDRTHRDRILLEAHDDPTKYKKQP